MALQEENDDLRQELENDADFPMYPRSAKRRGQLDHSHTQEELEDLMQENQQLQERVKVLDDENTGLKHTMSRQKEEILALQELNDKTGSKFEEEGKDTKTRLHVWKDKVTLLQKQMRDDKALSEMLSKEQRLRSALERRLEDAHERLKEAREEIVRLHEDLSQSEQQKKQHADAYADVCSQMEELRNMSEADRQAAERQAQELNDQIMMMTPGSSLDGAFAFDSPALHKNSVSLAAGQDLLSQMQMIDDEAEEEVEEEAPQVGEAESATQTAAADAEKARVAWESEKVSLAAELAAQRAASEAMEKTLAEERHSSQTVQSELQAMRSATQTAAADAEKARVAWESEKASLAAELAAQRAASEAMEKTLAEERLTTNQMPECTTNAENAGSPNGFKLAGASGATATKASGDRVVELEGQVVELETELAKARRLLQRWQEEREQQSWSSIVNSFMCATNR